MGYGLIFLIFGTPFKNINCIFSIIISLFVVQLIQSASKVNFRFILSPHTVFFDFDESQGCKSNLEKAHSLIAVHFHSYSMIKSVAKSYTDNSKWTIRLGAGLLVHR